MYESGRGLPKNEVSAVSLYRKAYAAGDSESALFLGFSSPFLFPFLSFLDLYIPSSLTSSPLLSQFFVLFLLLRFHLQDLLPSSFFFMKLFILSYHFSIVL